MTNDELDKAIDTACRHCHAHYGRGETEHIMMVHLKKLLAEQERRLDEEKQKEPVAWSYQFYGPSGVWLNELGPNEPPSDESAFREVTPLYTKD